MNFSMNLRVAMVVITLVFYAFTTNKSRSKLVSAVDDLAAQIDTSRCPVYLLTGEYDYSCRAENTRATAARIAGAKVTIMRELGHFPMSENPQQFRQYLLPVLEQISAKVAR